MSRFEFATRFGEEWRARDKNMKVAFVGTMVVALANLAAALMMSWDYGNIAGPAGVLCGAHYYIVVVALAYFGFRMWDGDPSGWYGVIVTFCAVIAVASIEGALNNPSAFVHAAIAAFGLACSMAPRKQFWRHAFVV